jgi:hypothetical protein
MTPLELMDMVEAYNDKLDITMQMLAWHASNIMNVHLKRKVTPNKLLGKDKSSKSMTMLDRENEVAKLRKALAERGNHNGDGKHNRNTSS